MKELKRFIDIVNETKKVTHEIATLLVGELKKFEGKKILKNDGFPTSAVSDLIRPLRNHKITAIESGPSHHAKFNFLSIDKVGDFLHVEVEICFNGSRLMDDYCKYHKETLLIGKMDGQTLVNVLPIAPLAKPISATAEMTKINNYKAQLKALEKAKNELSFPLGFYKEYYVI